ncbi:hypothetical protein B5S32_g3154 [[Candida] boidinii]|uniref:Unnamed protein product n=1 Tax=Candida boidinii TaxID=5477 RepID=A0ACB5TK63_CANBO|nr:hypothetical protein B5S32_g3154 [[Candida] boidinii]GME89904.1 unnamed protein product [[Candida] boidinii]
MSSEDEIVVVDNLSSDFDEPSSVQVIDGNKNFNTDLLSYIKQFYRSASQDNGLNYHIISVFGSQSTGKSTLLNKLFGTRFDVMDEVQRQQTTKGIWLGHANFIASSREATGFAQNDRNIFVMDVEGTDGRERGEDQDFERKSALFALSTSEVLIINLWENQVGLYQGANMGLLKTVFEVNLSIFAKNRQKCLLLFVIRDFSGVTPLKNLSETLIDELNKIWNQLNKPEGCEDVELTSFFDLKFASLGHKVFQIEQFTKDVGELGDRIVSDEIFSPDYHRNVPIDGWTIYAEQIWQQIDLNKDLDLPTQQILVARFRCDEIASGAYNLFEDSFNKIKFSDIEDMKEIASAMKNLREQGLEVYDEDASRYANNVYLDKREALLSKMDHKLLEIHDLQLSKFSKQAQNLFNDEVTNSKKSKKYNSFKEILENSMEKSLTFFIEISKILNIAEPFTETKHLNELKELLSSTSDSLKLKERENLIFRIRKKFQSTFKEQLLDSIHKPEADSWDKILSNFNSTSSELLSKYKKGPSSYDFELGLSEDMNLKTYVDIRKTLWVKFRDILHDSISEDSVSRILRNLFEDEFRYDDNGLPKLWRNISEVDSQFTKARTNALKALPILSNAVLSSTNSEIIPDVDITHEDDYEIDENELAGSHNFSHLLSNRQQQNILNKVKREMDAIYVEAKRSIVQNTTSIPLYFYGLLVVLGWNEFMAILNRPLLFIGLILLVSGVYIAYNTQTLGPIISVLQAMLDQTKKVAKERLRELVAEDGVPVKSQIPKESKENIELDSLDDKGKKLE